MSDMKVCDCECHKEVREGQGSGIAQACPNCPNCAQCPLCKVHFRHSISSQHINECSTGITSGTMGMAVTGGEEDDAEK